MKYIVELLRKREEKVLIEVEATSELNAVSEAAAKAEIEEAWCVVQDFNFVWAENVEEIDE